MRVLILYYSKTGHTLEAANATAEGIRSAGSAADMTDVKGFLPEDVAAYDGFIVGSPCWAGSVTPWGVAKPVLNAFRMFSLLAEQRVATANSVRRDLTALMKPEARASTDIDVLATRGPRAVSAIVWHHHDDGVSGPAQPATLRTPYGSRQPPPHRHQFPRRTRKPTPHSFLAVRENRCGFL